MMGVRVCPAPGQSSRQKEVRPRGARKERKGEGRAEAAAPTSAADVGWPRVPVRRKPGRAHEERPHETIRQRQGANQSRSLQGTPVKERSPGD